MSIERPAELTRADADHELGLLVKDVDGGHLVHCGSEELDPEFGESVYDAIEAYVEQAREHQHSSKEEHDV